MSAQQPFESAVERSSVRSRQSALILQLYKPACNRWSLLGWPPFAVKQNQICRANMLPGCKQERLNRWKEEIINYCYKPGGLFQKTFCTPQIVHSVIVWRQLSVNIIMQAQNRLNLFFHQIWCKRAREE